MMRFLRIFIRIAALAVWFTVMLFYALPSPIFLKRRDAMKRNCRICGLWARGILRILNVRIEANRAMPEEKGILLVSNHLGYLDIVVHAALSGLRFAPKAELRSWPLLGPYIALSYPVWINRKNHLKAMETLRQFLETLENGIPLIVYPEGTSTDGLHGLLPFKSTPFEAAVESGRPTVPLITHYVTPEGEMNPAWFGDQEFLPHLVKLLGIPEITARIVFLDPVLPENRDRKELASAVRAEMIRVYNKEMGASYV